MVGTLRSILNQQAYGGEGDAGADVRRLLEHAAFLAWMAADPSDERIEAWRKADLKSRLAADADVRDHGVALFTDEQRIAWK